MRITQTLLLAITLLALSCTAQKKYKLVLSVQDSAPTDSQLDSTISVIKKRLQPFDKGNTAITASPDGKSITLQTACSNQDFIQNVLLKKGKLELMECFTLQDVEAVDALQKTNEAMNNAVQQGLPVVSGVSNAVFEKENTLFKLIYPQQPYESRDGATQYAAYIGTAMDSSIPLIQKCLPLLYERLPNCKVYFKKIEYARAKVQASEVYLIRTNTTFDASRHVANANADKGDGKHPAVAMLFDKVGTYFWAKMTAKNVGKYIAIIVDDKLLSIPIVFSAIEGGSTQISGGFTWEEAKHIAAVLENGYAPLTLKIASINVAK